MPSVSMLAREEEAPMPVYNCRLCGKQLGSYFGQQCPVCFPETTTKEK